MLDRLLLLIGKENTERLQKMTVLVVGVGGVGGFAVEALVRSGVGKIILVDHDRIEESNLNRQLIASNSTIGKSKVATYEERIHDINPACQVLSFCEFLTPLNIDMVFQGKVDYVIDACDTMATKKELIRQCLKRQIPLISCMGMGKRLDPGKVKVTELRKTAYDPMAKILRKMVKEEKIREKIMVVCSEEAPQEIDSKVISSTIFVPAVAGIMCAHYVVQNGMRGGL